VLELVPFGSDARASSEVFTPERADDVAILRTVTYASLFQFPLTLDELHRRLMDRRLGPGALRRRLASPSLRTELAITDGFVHPPGAAWWLALRRRRERHTRALLAAHRRILDRLGTFPYVRLVALSGACAHGNASDPDVDVFVVTRAGRAWTVSLALMLLAKARGLRRTLCLNYVIDEAALALPERDTVTAAEIVGLRPLAGRAAYLRFVAANAWCAPLFPNFFARHRRDSATVPEAGPCGWLERALDLTFAPAIEAVSRAALGSYLRWKTRGRTGVALDPHRLKLHTLDHRPRLAAAFASALRRRPSTAARTGS
jgi:hypothetical protein